MFEESIVDDPLPRDDNETETVVKPDKVYKCEGCGETFPTGIAKATHCRNCKEYATWKAEQGDVDAKQREDVKDERESVFRGEGEPNEILRQIPTDFPGVLARNVISFDVNCAHARAT